MYSQPSSGRAKVHIHGDDFATVGVGKDSKWMRGEVEKTYELKTHVLGPDKDDSQQARAFNRILTWTQGGVSYDAGPRHAGIAIVEPGLNDAHGVVTLGTKEEGTTSTHRVIKLCLTEGVNRSYDR